MNDELNRITLELTDEELFELLITKLNTRTLSMKLAMAVKYQTGWLERNPERIMSDDVAYSDPSQN